MQPDPRKAMEKLLVDVRVSSLMKTIKRLDRAGRSIIINGLNSQLTDARKRLLLSELRREVSIADEEIRDWLVQSISTSYVHGMNYSTQVARMSFGDFAVATAVGAQAISFTPVTVQLVRGSAEFSPHLDAVNALLGDAYLDFGTAMTSFTRSGEKLLNDALKRQIRSSLLRGRLEGEAIRDISKTVKDNLVSKGFVGLTDRSGREWTIERYSEMLTRTHILRANNEGTINRAKDFGVDIVEVSSHGTTCPICKPYEGTFFSISGKDKKYPALSGQEPPYHPNCKHTLLYRPDLGDGNE